LTSRFEWTLDFNILITEHVSYQSFDRIVSALQQLEDVAIPSKRKEPLKALANYLLMRDK
jgi:hypothetical protein